MEIFRLIRKIPSNLYFLNISSIFQNFFKKETYFNVEALLLKKKITAKKRTWIIFTKNTRSEKSP